LCGWVCFVLQGYYGLGRHTKTQSKTDGEAFDHIAFWQSIISAIAALGLLKISIALFLLRLSNNKWYSRSLWALIGFVSFYSFGAWLTFFLRCQPMQGFWDRRYSASCYSVKLLVTFGLINTGKQSSYMALQAFKRSNMRPLRSSQLIICETYQALGRFGIHFANHYCPAPLLFLLSL
jgi:hypothetical protein